MLSMSWICVIISLRAPFFSSSSPPRMSCGFSWRRFLVVIPPARWLFSVDFLEFRAARQYSGSSTRSPALLLYPFMVRFSGAAWTGRSCGGTVFAPPAALSRAPPPRKCGQNPDPAPGNAFSAGAPWSTSLAMYQLWWFCWKLSPAPFFSIAFQGIAFSPAPF